MRYLQHLKCLKCHALSASCSCPRLTLHPIALRDPSLASLTPIVRAAVPPCTLGLALGLTTLDIYPRHNSLTQRVATKALRV